MKKMIINILVILLIIIVLPLVIALFVKRDYFHEREIIINKPKQEVFHYLKFLKNQNDYNAWIKMDPGMKQDLRGADGIVGSVYAWDGKKAGKGELELMRVSEGERIDMELRFEKPFKAIGHAHFTTEAVSDNQTKVKWGMKGRTPYPMNFINLFNGSMLGKSLENGLTDIKNILEK
jgi:hypothetical protein